MRINFLNGCSGAVGRWSDALDVNVTTSSSSAEIDIRMYGVTPESYTMLTGGQWLDTTLGLTTRALDVDKGYSFVSGTNKRINIYETTETVTIYILLDTDSTFMESIITHELGHAVGFDQHSNNSSHIMYPTPTYDGLEYRCAISADEAHDLKLIYDRYN